MNQRSFFPLANLLRGFSEVPVQNSGVVRIGFDVTEEGDGYRFVSDMPGFKKEDISIGIEGRDLMISAVRERSSESEEGKYVMSERFFGRSERAFRLPEDIDRAGVKASYKDGVLEIIVPKSAKKEIDKIRID